MLLGPVMLEEFRAFARRLIGRALAANAKSMGAAELAYVTGGILAAIEAWLEKGCRQEIAQLVAEIERATASVVVAAPGED